MELTQEQTQILNALNTLTEPAGCKVIGEAADMPWRTVMAKLRGLKKELTWQYLQKMSVFLHFEILIKNKQNFYPKKFKNIRTQLGK